MHDHPASVVVYLSTGKVMMATPDGKSVALDAKRGGVQFSDAQTHLPTSAADGAEAIVVELKVRGTPQAGK